MQQLTVYIQENSHLGHKPLYLQILELAVANGSTIATALKGVAGYSVSSHALSTPGFADVAQHLSLMIVIVGVEENLAKLLPHLEELIQPVGGLITIQNLESQIYVYPQKHSRGVTNE